MKHRKAIITGAGSGIGKAIALRFASLGAEVFALDVDTEAGGATVKEILDAGGMASFFYCDVTNMTAVQNLYAQLAPFYILVNNAGIAHVGDAMTTSEEDFERVYQVNVKGVYHCLQAALPHMVHAGEGVILNICSIAAHVGLSDRFAYSMSKGAVSAMTLSVARDFLTRGIRCNSLSPARVHTPFVDGFIARNYPGREQEMLETLAKTQPIGRMGKPEEIAALAAFLCSSDAAFITGSDYPIDGGFMTLNTGNPR